MIGWALTRQIQFEGVVFLAVLDDHKLLARKGGLVYRGLALAS